MINHIVLFKFKAEASDHDIRKTIDGFRALPKACKNAAGETYIVGFKDGVNITIENFKKGLTHGFIMEFASVEDRDYYVKEDKAHAACIQTLGAIEDVLVFDFQSV